MEMDNYTAEQRECVEEFRSRMTGLLSKEMFEDDSMFLRFLVARDFNVDAAELMLKNNLSWRRDNKIDALIKNYTAPEVAEKYIAFNSIGYSKDGLPVTISRFGNIDFKGVLKALKKSDIILHVAHYFEEDIQKMKTKSAEMGKTIDKFIYIFDLSNFSLSTATYKPALDIMMRLISMFDNNYPERLKTAYIVNASFYFTIFWAVLSPFLAGATFKKIKLFGKDGWQSEVLKEIDAEILPAFLGGKLTDPDGNPMCNTLINHAGPVPAKYFSKMDNTFRKTPTTKKIVVHRYAKEQIEMFVEKPGYILEWEFEVKNRDICFSVLYKDSDDINSSPKEVVPKQKVETVIASETGWFRCERPGIYILEFDNTYSWMHSKELYYTVSVLKSDKVVSDS